MPSSIFRDPVALKIYTDGSCLFPNPGGSGGIAGIAEYPDDFDRLPEPIFQIGYHTTTNNRMELRACIEALKFIRSAGEQFGLTRAIIFTDSQYVCECSRLAPYWPGGQLVNREGRPVANRDLWREFLRTRSHVPFRVEVRWLPGKTTGILRTVDKLAKQAASRPTAIDYGFRPGSIGRRYTPGKVAAKPFPANGQSVTIRIYRIKSLKATGGLRQHIVFFDLFSPSTRDYIATYFAYISAHKDIHRNRCYVVTFNNSRTYPIIETTTALENCPERRTVASIGAVATPRRS